MSPIGTLSFPIVSLFNHVLSDYPAARQRLQAHDGKVISARIGPVAMRMRVTEAGEMEPIGDSGAAPASIDADVLFSVPLVLLPRFAAGDPAAFQQIVFTGDSELAATLSDIARNIEWDVETDLSRIVGDAAAHRIVNGAYLVHAWRKDAAQRLTANLAEYLTEERQAFVTAGAIENLAQQNEALRDAIARLGARLAAME